MWNGVLVVGGEEGWWGDALLKPYVLAVWKGGQRVWGGVCDEVGGSGRERLPGLVGVVEVEAGVGEAQLSLDGEQLVDVRCELLVQVGGGDG